MGLWRSMWVKGDEAGEQWTTAGYNTKHDKSSCVKRPNTQRSKGSRLPWWTTGCSAKVCQRSDSSLPKLSPTQAQHEAEVRLRINHDKALATKNEHTPACKELNRQTDGQLERCTIKRHKHTRARGYAKFTARPCTQKSTHVSCDYIRR